MQPQLRADAGQVLAFDHGGFQSQLGGADGGDIAAGPGSDDDHVVIV
jgi:hypothetical protein